jgi:hypothetical protein
LEGAVNIEEARTGRPKPALDMVEAVIRQQNVALLRRVLKAEIDPVVVALSDGC